MSMTGEEAIRRIQDHMRVHRIGEGHHIYIKEALDMAIAALQEQEENRWTPVTERMPEEYESIVPNWGTVSKPLLVAFVCTTSEEPYPKNCVVCETMSHNGRFTHKSYSGEYKAIAWRLKPMPPKEALK